MFALAPYEFDMARWPENSTKTAWPGNYKFYHVQCAWEAWQAAIASMAAPAPDIFAAAKVLAECMDYPWEFMPSQGRDTMRAHVRAVLAAAFPTPPIAALAAKETT